jgi:hypothetical protein
MQVLTLKDGTVLKGFWNGKVYNTTVYFNAADNDGVINFKKSTKYERTEIKSIENERIGQPLKINNVADWMKEMERTER